MKLSELIKGVKVKNEINFDEDITNINRILDLLDAEDDVQQVYHNWDE